MASKVVMIKGDTAPPLRTTLSNADGAQDLTGVTLVELRLEPKGTDGEAVAHPCAVESPATAGVVVYDWQPGDTDTPGNYDVEYQVTYADGSVQTFPNMGKLTLVIRDPRTIEA